MAETAARVLATARANQSPDNVRALGLVLTTVAGQVDGWSYPTARRLREAAGLCQDAANGRVLVAAAIEAAADALAEAGAS